MIVEIQRKSHVQEMTYQDFEERIRDGEVSPDTLVRFEVVTGDSFRPVGELELYHALADPQRLIFRKNLTEAGTPIVTALLIGVQIRIYFGSLLDGGQDFLERGFTNWAPAIIEQGQVYRLITYGLLHTSFTHLLFNLLFLAYTAYHLERAMGRANLTVLYFVSVFTGGLLSMFMSPDRPSLGASGGVFGLLAAVVILGWKHWENLPQQARKYFGWALAPYLGFSILSGLSAENVDNWGHLGGLLGGIALMTVLDPEVLPDRREVNARRRRSAVGLLVGVNVLLLLAGTRLVPLADYADAHGWNVRKPSQWGEGWTFTGDRGWFSPTLQANLSIATTVHPRPIDAETATVNLEKRIASGSKNPQRLSWDSLTIDDIEARKMVLRFELYGEPQEVTAVVLVRGVYEHRIQFQSVADAAANYQPLVDRIIDSIQPSLPAELVEAQRRADFHPRSWEPALALGDALYQIGAPEDALEAYQRALRLDDTDARPLIGLLRVHADYGIPGGLEAARKALVDHPTSLQIVESAADVIAQAGHRQEAIAVLDDAWRRSPNNAVLRRIRLQWGLSVDDPAATPEQPPE
ncbi:MAG: rhomboid family intramembrane serine protease [Myxococcota bacterium]